MVHSTACLDLVNIRNRSQVSVILTAFEQRNETVSLTQRLLACGKKFLLKKKKKKKNSSTLQTTLLSIHLAVWPIRPQVQVSFQTL